MMKRLALLAAGAIVVLGLVAAGGDYKHVGGTYYWPVVSKTTNGTANDSTIADGSIGLMTVDGHTNSIQLRAILHKPSKVDSSGVAHAGIGVQDSGIVSLWAGFGGVYSLVAVDTADDLPCTLYYANVAAGLDTLLKEELQLRFSVFDTLGDSSFTFHYPVTYNVLLK